MTDPVLSPSELARVLRDPAACEEWSPLCGRPLLEVDVQGERADAVIDLAALARIPAVTMGVGDVHGAPEGLAEILDILARDDAEAQAVAAATRAHPHAASSLAQLLRLSASLDVHEGLVAESLVYSTLQSGPEFAAWRASRPVKQSPPSREPAVAVLREGACMTVRLNRPEKRNAFSVEMRDAFCEALRLALQDETVTEVVLTGAGPAFSSGGDLDEFGSFPDPATAHQVRAARSPARTLYQLADRTEARVHGACIGAGAELPAFCRRVVARPDAFFQLPEVALGLVPGAGGTASLPRRIGRERTAWLGISGRPIDADTALAWGLVDAIEARA